MIDRRSFVKRVGAVFGAAWLRVSLFISGPKPESTLSSPPESVPPLAPVISPSRPMVSIINPAWLNAKFESYGENVFTIDPKSYRGAGKNPYAIRGNDFDKNGALIPIPLMAWVPQPEPITDKQKWLKEWRDECRRESSGSSDLPTEDKFVPTSDLEKYRSQRVKTLGTDELHTPT